MQSTVTVSMDNDCEGLISNLNKEKKEHELAIALLGHSTRQAYRRVRKSLQGIIDVPTYEAMEKLRPSISEFNVFIMQKFDEDVRSPINNDSNSARVLPIVEQSEPVIPCGELEDMDLVLHSLSQPTEVLDGAKIDGQYDDYMNLLKDKHARDGRSIGDDEHVLVLDSIDGAEHLRSKNKNECHLLLQLIDCT